MAGRYESIDLQIEVDQKDIDYVVEKLKGTRVKVPSAIKNALNRVGRKARKDLVMGAKQTYTYKHGPKLKDVSMTEASPDSLSVVLRSAGKTHAFREFKYTARARAGAKIRIIRGHALKLVGEPKRRGFLTELNSGAHIAHRTGAARFPIKVPHSLSVPKMLEMIWKGKHGRNVKEETQRNLKAQLEAEVAKHI